MTKEILEQLNSVIDEEILCYCQIKVLYEEKQNILSHPNADMLFDVDSRILEQFECAKKISEKRKYMSGCAGGKELGLSDLAKKSQNIDEALSASFSEQKSKLQSLAKEIFHLEEINRELVKHGLVITNKTLSLIFDGINIMHDEYDKKGKNKSTVELSSVVEDI